MASENKGHPHYPYPNLGGEDARIKLEEKIANIFTEVLEKHNYLIKYREIKENQNKIFKESARLEGQEKISHLLTMPLNIKMVPFRQQIIAPAGIGKTYTTIKNLERCHGMVIWLMVPTLVLAKEVTESIKKNATSVDVILYQGRNEDTCERHKITQYIGGKGLNIQNTLCKNGEDECPYYSGCPYQAQRKEIHETPKINPDDPVRVIVMTHGYLVANSGISEPDFVIIDETHWQIFTKITSEKYEPHDLTLAEIRNAEDKSILHHEFYSEFIKILTNSMQKNTVAFPSLLAKNDPEFLDKAINHIKFVITKHGSPDIKPRYSDKKIESSVQDWKIPRLKLIYEVLQTLQHEIKLNKKMASAITYNPERDTIRIHTLKQNMIPSEVPVLMIDASADKDINKFIWGSNLKSYEIRTERNLEITQVRQRTFSKSSLGISYYPDGKWQPTEKNTQFLKETIMLVNEIAEQTNENILFVSSKKIGNKLKDKLADNVKITHYGALRGRNNFENFNTAIIIGREEPWYETVEGLSRALRSRTAEILLHSQPFIRTPRYRRLKNESLELEYIHIHIDPFVQKILEQIREREIEQAIDRLRLIHNGKTKRVYLLTSIVIDVTITDSKSWSELLHTTKIDQAIQYVLKKAKAFPLGDRDIFAVSPSNLWSTQNATGSYISRHGGIKWVISLIIYYMGTDPLLVVKYRIAGQRGKDSLALVSETEQDLKNALERILGIEISKVEIDEKESNRMNNLKETSNSLQTDDKNEGENIDNESNFDQETDG